jgi:acyl-CoA thioester hydrolase
MPRLDRARLEKGIFPFQCEVATRFADIDRIGHVNNVATASILQEARARLAHEFDFAKVRKGQGLVVVSLTIEFVSDMFHPDPVQVSAGLLEIGRSSYRLGQIARQNGRICAFAEAVQVASDKNRSAPFNDEWRDKLKSLLIRYPGENSD